MLHLLPPSRPPHPPLPGLTLSERLRWVRLRRSVESWVADARQRADRSALAFEEGEGEDEETNTHDAQDDHAWDECTCHCVHLKHWSFQMGWSRCTKQTNKQKTVRSAQIRPAHRNCNWWRTKHFLAQFILFFMFLRKIAQVWVFSHLLPFRTQCFMCYKFKL